MAGLPVALFATGQILNTFGQLEADEAQAQASEANAEFLREQAKLFEKSTQRELLTFRREAQVAIGEQITAFARGGVDISSGTALNVIADTKAQAIREQGAIQLEGQFRKRMALLRAASQEKVARDIRRTAPLRAAGGFVTGAAGIASLTS